MNKLNFPELFILQHTFNTCLHNRKTYHWQSRATQQAGIFKRFGVLIPMATFDKAIRRLKDRFHFKKQHRTGKVTGGGYRWTSAITRLTFELVTEMRRLGLITYEQLRAFLVILGLVKERGPAKLRATPAAQDEELRKPRHRTFLFPT